MATSEFWQRVSDQISPSPDLAGESSGRRGTRVPRAPSRLWIILDILTVLVSTIIATTLEMRTGPVTSAREFYHGTLIQGRPMGILLGLLCCFTVALIVISRRLHLYAPANLTNFLHEQRLSVQACFTAGLFLTGTLYLIHAADVPRSIVLITLALVTVSLSLRRFIYRVFLYRRFARGIGTRNVLIVGTGDEAKALRHHFDSIRNLGYTFKGFIDPRSYWTPEAPRGEVLGSLDTLFHTARKEFIDEIIFASTCDRQVIQDVLEQSRTYGVDLRLVPEMYGGLTWNSPVEYIGQFPTIPLHRGEVPELSLVLKRFLDLTISLGMLLLLAPFLLLIALAIKLDSRGPVLYGAERIGKRARVFRCLKFRTMVRDAEQRRESMQHMNERDAVLFKIAKDPRITRVGRLLRKYSLDELPQFLNVLRGDMSIVGPRPPLASEVREYKLGHMRRLSVTPGITGLWQVEGRQDPSFDSYVSLDLTYVENWSIWLDLKIMVRTFGVVLSGTGT
jgi:exopolysaccharide biosynthesis polyprenyl glycosylphosphotransferase